MLDTDALSRHCEEAGLAHWLPALLPLLRERLDDSAHGDLARWRNTLETLRACRNEQHEAIREALMSLAPWRKGPFEFAGIYIDSEWRSDHKWARLEHAIAPLAGRKVLDVGCGNGYYARRMLEAGATSVFGVDPTLLYLVQFLAVSIFLPVTNAFVLPLRVEELPQRQHVFDTCFSMGVLYHQRAPLEHLRCLHGMLQPSGQLVLETIFLPGEAARAWTPPERYARMRNVWQLPTIAELGNWLRASGFVATEIVDRSITSVAEQRSTDWMPFESLAEALHPDDPNLTIEGWPAPRRVVILANAG